MRAHKGLRPEAAPNSESGEESKTGDVACKQAGCVKEFVLVPPCDDENRGIAEVAKRPRIQDCAEWVPLLHEQSAPLRPFRVEELHGGDLGGPPIAPSA